MRIGKTVTHRMSVLDSLRTNLEAASQDWKRLRDQSEGNLTPVKKERLTKKNELLMQASRGFREYRQDLIQDLETCIERRFDLWEPPLSALVSLRLHLTATDASSRVVWQEITQDRIHRGETQMSEMSALLLGRNSPSMTKILQNPYAIRYLYLFLEREHSTENVEFYQEVELYKKLLESDPRLARDKAEEIQLLFLSPDCRKSVNISHKSSALMQGPHPTPTLFDACQAEIVDLLQTDTYYRFIGTKVYQRLRSRFRDISHFLRDIPPLIQPPLLTRTASLLMRKDKPAKKADTLYLPKGIPHAPSPSDTQKITKELKQKNGLSSSPQQIRKPRRSTLSQTTDSTSKLSEQTEKAVDAAVSSVMEAFSAKSAQPQPPSTPSSSRKSTTLPKPPDERPLRKSVSDPFGPPSPPLSASDSDLIALAKNFPVSLSGAQSRGKKFDDLHLRRKPPPILETQSESEDTELPDLGRSPQGHRDPFNERLPHSARPSRRVSKPEVPAQSIHRHRRVSTSVQADRFPKMSHTLRPTQVSFAESLPLGIDLTKYPQMETIVDYVSEASNEMSLHLGDIVFVLDADQSGWCYGQKKDTTERGYFPAGFVRHITPPSDTVLTDSESTDWTVEVQVVFSFAAESSDELGLRKGERLKVYRETSDDWWEGINCEGRTGFFPRQCVKPIAN
eukprot:TRINITY_DN6880_c0_g2_i2.p1 TRINITY_DN6880_c0_g2~~TRINITY_DN6880_c0_g2_i2.p1  ORF type:complete len:678 (+),score=132.94 TRINITY_DN6880_c0_g2_i2:91-2124(+)